MFCKLFVIYLCVNITLMMIANIFTILFLFTGKVTDKSTGQSIPSASVQIEGLNRGTITDEDGNFNLGDIPPGHYTLNISHLNYKLFQLTFSITGNTKLDFALLPRDFVAEEVIINQVRAGEISAVTKKTLSKAAIEKNYAGQEMPVLLSSTPSINYYSDGGNFYGYSYMRLRGLDQSRINFTLNGLPLNEPEDQGVYFANFADFANSLESIQVQRGVGTSTSGTASFAGSVNFESLNLSNAPAAAELQVGRGSFNSYRISPELYTGLMKNGLSLYGRFSMMGSDGYKYNAGTQASSFFMSGAYFGKKYLIKFTAFSGKTSNGLAYNPVSIDSIRKDPRSNIISSDEKDNFIQSLSQLQYVRAINENTTLTSSIYYTRLDGGYDIKFSPAIIQNFSVASGFAGAMFNLNYEKGQLGIQLGIHTNTYRRNHFSALQPFISQKLYYNTGFKKEVSAFAKLVYSFNSISFFVDLQLRAASFKYLPDKNYNLSSDKIGWLFFNPKAGINYQISKQVNLYASVAYTGREPTRNDIFAGFDDLDTSNIHLIGDFNKVKPESVTDFELGVNFIFSKFNLQANVFEMQFRNEIAPIGQLSYIGLPLRKNVASSFRRGFEWDFSYKILPSVSYSLSGAYLFARIKNYLSEQGPANVVFQNITPLLSPKWLINQSLNYKANKSIDFSLSGKYAGESFLANDNDNNFMTPSFFITDFASNFRFLKNYFISFQVNNLTDRQYFTSGQVQTVATRKVPFYFAQAGRNYFITFHAKF